jgi:hypothetical protein
VMERIARREGLASAARSASTPRPEAARPNTYIFNINTYYFTLIKRT